MIDLFSSRRLIGSRVKELRHERKMSTFELAECLFCSQEYINRIELGSAKLSIDKIYRISICLNVDIETLLSGIGFQVKQKTKKSVCYYQAECIV
ncbi:helix-turn-helix transcriptional regulator (plasmid) [Providencia sp. R33]|uniref:helix-turn-helix domain-containing protein n=1 Tax=Providencia sp. R33 TaxID=2828763 RepID=UPI001C5B508E|nr:helix-turn-helix transcriptional regulator [Providencia sp. R33]QXX85183.1 helix-turn-helix transcriptional regulator [Providencia sp. R33]